jgi:hypothetical protein
MADVGLSPEVEDWTIGSLFFSSLLDVSADLISLMDLTGESGASISWGAPMDGSNLGR